MTGHAHVIPVDTGLTPEEAWKEICIFGRRITYTPTAGPPETWATVECDGEECANIERSSS